ncbi:hypothetical protein MLD38_036479 [Melastoma candidum]|uniref:Uncharacterized protein n=1 Tax=Melastoma candidum TaxID=119954 RepID=A0ACB9LJS8_9MYRT|nr:hypothetical protein MLD38_036479 [Melastoma candidum]
MYVKLLVFDLQSLVQTATSPQICVPCILWLNHLSSLDFSCNGSRELQDVQLSTDIAEHHALEVRIGDVARVCTDIAVHHSAIPAAASRGGGREISSRKGLELFRRDGWDGIFFLLGTAGCLAGGCLAAGVAGDRGELPQWWSGVKLGPFEVGGNGGGSSEGPRRLLPLIEDKCRD